MTNQSNLDSLFNPTIEKREATKKTGEYSPQASKGKSNVYKSIIRFIAWHQDPNHSIKEKFTCWLVDPLTNKGRYIDCPTSINQPSPINEMYWNLKNSDNALLQQQADRFSRKQTYAALIQVIQDEHAPDLVGKILVWRFGKKIYDKIQQEMNPPMGEPKNPFNLINGRFLSLHITLVSGYNNYDNSQFFDAGPQNPSGMRMYNWDTTPPTPLGYVNDSTDRNLVLEYLKVNSPDLNIYDFKPWGEEEIKYVNHVITFVGGQQASGLTASVMNNTPINNVIPSTPTMQPVTGGYVNPSLSNITTPIMAPTISEAVNNSSVGTVPGLNMVSTLGDPTAITAPVITGFDLGDLNLPNLNGISDPGTHTVPNGMGNLNDVFGAL